MKIEDVFAHPSHACLSHTLETSLSSWFREYSSCEARHGLWQRNRLPYGAFTRQLRAALAGMRPKGSEGVATGTWLLPCGVAASQVWQQVQAAMQQLRLELAILTFQHEAFTGFTGRKIGPVGARVEPLLWPKAQRVTRKQLEAQQQHAILREAAANVDPLAGLNPSRLRVRLDKAFRGGAPKLRNLIGDLLNLRATLPSNPKIDRVPLALAIQAMTETISQARVLVDKLSELTADQQESKERAVDRHRAKLAKKKTRRQKQLERQRARIVLRKQVQREHNAAMQDADVIVLADRRARKPAPVKLDVAALPVAATVTAVPLADKVWKVRNARWFVEFGDSKGTRRRLSIFYRDLTPDDRRQAQQMFALSVNELALRLEVPVSLAA